MTKYNVNKKLIKNCENIRKNGYIFLIGLPNPRGKPVKQICSVQRNTANFIQLAINTKLATVPLRNLFFVYPKIMNSQIYSQQNTL